MKMCGLDHDLSRLFWKRYSDFLPRMMPRSLLVLSFVACGLSTWGQVPVDIEIRFRDEEQAEQYGSYFETAAQRWESILPAWIDGRDDSGSPIFESIIVNASVFDFNASAIAFASPTLTSNDGNYLLSGAGRLAVNAAFIDSLISRGEIQDVLLHEMAHIFGIGTLWDFEQNGLIPYVEGTGRYTGPNALAQYRQEFNPDAEYVPVELGGTSASRDSHWDEGYAFDGSDTLQDLDGLTVIDPDSIHFGKSRSQTLLSGALDLGSFISNTTGGALQDLGFVVNFSAIQATLAGDYNQDGVVDTADYAIWRDSLGDSPGSLPNDVSGGVIGQSQYETWRENFGATIDTPTLAANLASVPEPSTVPIAIASAGLAWVVGAGRSPRVPGDRVGGDVPSARPEDDDPVRNRRG